MYLLYKNLLQTYLSYYGLDMTNFSNLPIIYDEPESSEINPFVITFYNSLHQLSYIRLHPKKFYNVFVTATIGKHFMPIEKQYITNLPLELWKAIKYQDINYTHKAADFL